MLRPKSLTTENDIRIEFYRDIYSYLVAYVEITVNGAVNIEIYADLEELTAAEMRDLWAKLKIEILPSNFMERIRTSVLVHLQNVGRVDLVAVCLDNAAHMEDKKRL